MRILIASDHYPPFIGGAHRWAELLSHGLADRGHEVSVITEWHGRLPRRELTGRVVIHRVRQLRTAAPRLISDPRQRHSPPFPDPLTIRDAGRLICEIEPDVVLAHGWIAFSVAVPLADQRIPMLLSAHDYGYVCPTRTLLHQGQTCSGPALAKCVGCATDFYGGAPKGATCVAGVLASRRVLARAVWGLQSVSSFVDETLWPQMFASRVTRRPIKRFVIPAFLDIKPPVGVDRSVVARYVARLPTEPFILFVGSLRRIKGVDVLLDAYERLPDRPPLVLMGTRHADTPRRLPPDTTMLEDVPHPAVMIAFRRALFGVFPSVWPEPLGTVAIECASQGTPVIATAPSGMVDIVGDGAGILVGPGDPAALATAMRSLIDDPDLREGLGRAGRARSTRFLAENVLGEYERALAELVADRAAAR